MQESLDLLTSQENLVKAQPTKIELPKNKKPPRRTKNLEKVDAKSIEEEERRTALDLRKKAFTYLRWSNGAAFVAAVLILLLQGFRVWDFELSRELLYLLITNTIGNLAGLMVFAYRFLFPSPTTRRRTKK